MMRRTLTGLAAMIAATAAVLAGPSSALAGGPTIDLSITKTAIGSGFTVGTNGQFTITVTNNSGTLDTPAASVEVTDTLPAGLTFVSGVGTGWSCSAVGQAVTCDLAPALLHTTSSSFVLTVGVGATAIPSVSNTAHAGFRASPPGPCCPFDPSLKNNDSTATVPVSAAATPTPKATAAPAAITVPATGAGAPTGMPLSLVSLLLAGGAALLFGIARPRRRRG